MKRITLSVAILLFGGVYMANAQVGIGTPMPSPSAQLDIVSEDSGVLIPRVSLELLTKYGPIKGTATQSLLVYNVATVGTDIVPGFYYWENAQWNKIINKTELDTAINNFGGDLTEIKKLVSYIVPSSPVNNPAVPQSHTTMVYNPTTKQMMYVTLDTSVTPNVYKTDIIDLAAIIQGAETKTFIRTVTGVGGTVQGNIQHIYFSEEVIQNWLAATPGNLIEDIPNTYAGAVVIDAGADIINNFENILNQSTTYGGSPKTVKNIIKELVGTVDGNVIYKNIGTAPAINWVFQYWDPATSEYVTISLGDIVQANETKTRIIKTTVDDEIIYNYANEGNKPDANGIAVVGTPDVINVTEDMVTSITNNEDVKTAIKNVFKGGGNVYYTATEILAAANPGGLTIPAESLFTINALGVRVLIDFSGLVLSTITNNAGDIKLILGNKYDSSTHYKTGDTWIDGKDIYAYKTTTNIVVNSAVTSGITLPVATPSKIVSIKLYRAQNVVTSSVTDVVLTGAAVAFNIGTGNLYNILPVGAYDVIVEFTSN